MTVTFQSWMQAVWHSVMEPSDAARTAINMGLPRDGLWMALGLITVMNVILLALFQMVSPPPATLDQQLFSATPFSYAAIIGVFLALFVVSVYQVGKFMGGAGTFAATLAVIVWFQSISLTFEAIQLALVLISPAISSIFSLLSLGALIWCFVNFINVLHAFENIGKSVLAIILALIGTALMSGIILTILGLNPAGAAT